VEDDSLLSIKGTPPTLQKSEGDEEEDDEENREDPNEDDYEDYADGGPFR